MERDVDVIELGTASDLTKGGMGPLDEEVLVLNFGAGISADRSAGRAGKSLARPNITEESDDQLFQHS